ncbi:MAG: CDP-glucose 4,6-dehydratase, partial [Planctomycetia bacterium]|nr:CDP-glucose 4,6-dehydratase [Planctomycetia bacterium]
DQHHVADIRDRDRVSRLVAETEPAVIIHMAAQSLVRESYRAPAETFEVNVMGTVAVLEAVRLRARPCVVVIVTSDKCYENREQLWGYREIDRMGGRDPYSASKGTAELVVAAYRRSFFPPDRLDDHQVHLATVRSGNVIGGGDWSNDRIIADLARGLSAGKSVGVRSPDSIRPWQHVLEPLCGYLTLASRMLLDPQCRWCDAWNFGPLAQDAVSVREVTDAFVAAWGSGRWVDQSNPRQPHEAHVLRLNVDKALTELNWRPRWNVAEAIERTARWYHRFYDRPEAALEATLADLRDYGGN